MVEGVDMDISGCEYEMPNSNQDIPGHVQGSGRC
jgi:hypothetical protein